MPKMKTRRASAKRFKITASGKLKRASAFKSHILTKKNRKTKRGLRGTKVVDASNQKALKRQLPYL